MGLYKEADWFLREHAQKQVQIYNDACDIGIPVDSISDPLCKDLKQIFADEGGWKGFMGNVKKYRDEQRNTDGVLVSLQVVVHLPWEYADDSKDLTCSKWTITYCNDIVRRKRFVSFDVLNVTCSEKEVWGE